MRNALTIPTSFTIGKAMSQVRKFSASESDVIFNVEYNDAITYETVALWLQDITGKETTAEQVENEFSNRI
jgi:hypothetical protein